MTSAIEIGPASGPNVTLEADTSSNSAPRPAKTKKHEEYQYLDLIQDILNNGEHRPDR